MQSLGSAALYFFSGYRNRCTTVFKRRKLELYCSQEKETGAFILVHYCSQDKEIGAILFLGEGNCQLVLSCFQEKVPGALLLLGDRNCCSQEKETCALLFLGEENMYTTVIRRRKLVLYCFKRRDLVLNCSQ